jgi:Methyltransferase domain
MGAQVTPPQPNAGETQRGAAVYTARTLLAYDVVTLRFSSRWLWRCNRDRVLRHYDQNISCNHLDIGPGTGWFLRNAQFPCGDPNVTLLDLNSDSLAVAANRIRNLSPTSVKSDIFAPFPFQQKFDSIAANYVLHCLPGDWVTKSLAIGNAAASLSPTGVFFGSTVLGEVSLHNLVGRRTMKYFNQNGVFHNESDDLAGLRDVLDTHFKRVTTEMVGAVALFTARQPR